MTTLLSTSSLFTAKGLFLLQLVILCLTKLQKGVIQNHIFVNCASNNVVFSGRNRGVTNNGGFNYEIEKRVHERVSELMNKPVTMLGLVERFAQTDIFEPPVLRPHQKDDFFRILWTIWKEFGIDLYYGQEDGLFLGVIKGAGTYQEGRGSNGYLLDEEVASDEEKYMKRLYFNKCLDRETGISENCTLKEDEDYVSCVNSCKLAPCPSSVEGEYNNTSNSSSTIYCPTYEILQAPTSGMGYIPRYYYCLSNSGRFIENDPPNSVESPSHVRNGLCTHTDGVTLVNGRTSEKQTYAMADRRNYVFLREYDDGMAENYTSNNGDEAAALLYSDVAIADGQKTDQVFVGGYHSRRYEPRLRPWYIGTRELQNAFWTKPYPFATANDIGITYGKPLYYTDPTSGAKVFRGVIAVDYDLEEISRFLIDVFLAVEDQSEEETSDMNRYSSSSGATVLIVEDDGPHYIIGSSTGSKAAKKVRIEDESIDCDDDEIWSGDIECKTVRSTPEDFSHNNTRSNNNQNGVTQDAILALAFKAQKEAGFPKELVVSSPREEGYSYTNADGNSNFYVSQSLIYEQLEGQNLRWRIIVVMPVAVATNGELLWGDPMTAVVLTVALLGFGICIVLFYIYFSKRKALHVVMSDWRFTSAFILGCAMLNLSTLATLGPASDGQCMLIMWSYHLVFVLAFAPLLIKVWRIHKLVGSADRALRLSITNRKAMLYTLPIIMVQVLLLTLFSILDPPVKHSYVDIDGSSSYEITMCKPGTKAMFITEMVFEGILVVVGCVLAYMTRNIGSAFGEAKQLLFAMYNFALGAVFIVLVGFFLNIDRNTMYVIKAIGVFWATVFSCCAFVLPRLLQVKRDSQTRRSSLDNFGKSYSFYASGSKRFTGSAAGVDPMSLESSSGASGSFALKRRPSSSVSNRRSMNSVEFEVERTGESGGDTVPLPEMADVFHSGSSDSDFIEFISDVENKANEGPTSTNDSTNASDDGLQKKEEPRETSTARTEASV